MSTNACVWLARFSVNAILVGVLLIVLPRMPIDAEGFVLFYSVLGLFTAFTTDLLLLWLVPNVRPHLKRQGSLALLL